MLQSDQTDGDPKSVVIMGCGRIGTEIALALADQGYTIHILDLCSEALTRLPSSAVDSGQIVPIVGDGTLEKGLLEALINEADVFVAVSGHDSRNAMAAQIAKRVHEVASVVCRIDDPVRSQMYRELGITAVSATALVSESIVKAIRER